MNEITKAALSRRAFLATGGALFASTYGQAFALPGLGSQSRGSKSKVQRTLILVELKGGNDGLSTVIPLGDPLYLEARKSAFVAPDAAILLDERHGFNPNLKQLAAAFHQKKLAVIEGVGVPGGVRSHFKATDIWHSANPERAGTAPGWIAQLGDKAWANRGSDAVVHFGTSPLRSHFSKTRAPISVENPDHFATMGEGPDALMPGDKKKKPKAKKSSNPALERIRKLSDQAQQQSLRIRAATAGYRTPVEYPRTPLGQNLRDIAGLLNSPDGMTPRVLSTTINGFDTHARQKNAHDRQMTTVDDALGGLLADLERTEIGKRAVVVVYSEFGRRVNENASQGTDHGKGGPAFVLGHEIQPGFYGRVPSLKDLDSGDLMVTTDFRQLYATLIEDLFEVESVPLLGQQFEKLGILG